MGKLGLLFVTLFCAGLLIHPSARAEECSEDPSICEEVQFAQSIIAESLPQRVSKTMSFDAVSAFGRTLSLMVTWHMSTVEFREFLLEGGNSQRDIKLQLDSFAHKSVCGDDFLSDFIARGAAIQFQYRTKDGTPIANVAVSDCF